MDSDRRQKLDTLRHIKMARSAHGFVRGSTRLFYNWIAARPAGAIPEGPAIWICGDCHSGNLGPLANARGDVDIQICDLDEAVIGNPAFDLLRLSLSLASAARSTDFPGAVTARIIERVIDGYEIALEHDRPTEMTPPDAVRQALKSAIGQKWEHLAEERLDDNHNELPRGKKFWDISALEKSGLRRLLKTPEVEAIVSSLRPRDDARIDIVDLAFWVKGTNSLGKARYAALLSIREDDPSLCLLDIKAAGAPDTIAAPNAAMPAHPGQRVVDGARHLSPNLGERMVAGDLNGCPVFVRELRPQDLKLDIAHTKAADAVHAAYYLGHVVGRAHARQMHGGDREHWLTALGKARPADLDAPSWLWQSTVELLGLHEVAYLEHCRRFALED